MKYYKKVPQACSVENSCCSHFGFREGKKTPNKILTNEYTITEKTVTQLEANF